MKTFVAIVRHGVGCNWAVWSVMLNHSASWRVDEITGGYRWFGVSVVSNVVLW
jgi:hypothetical protein